MIFRKVWRSRPWDEWLLLLIAGLSMLLSIISLLYGVQVRSWEGSIPPPAGRNGGAGVKSLLASTAGAVSAMKPAVEALS